MRRAEDGFVSVVRVLDGTVERPDGPAAAEGTELSVKPS